MNYGIAQNVIALQSKNISKSFIRLQCESRNKTELNSYFSLFLLPPAYVGRREGNALTRVCPSINLSTGGGQYPYPIMLCNISQNAMGQLRGGTLQGPGGGVPCQVQPGGVPWLGGYPGWGVPCPEGRVPWLGGGTLAGGVPCPGGTLAGGYPVQGGTLPGGVPYLGGYPVRTT